MKYKEPKKIREVKINKELKKEFWEVFFIEGFLFLVTSILAVVCAFELNKLAQLKMVYLPATSLQDFLFSFIFVTFFVLIFILYKKAGKLKDVIYKGLFIITTFWGGMTVLNLFMPVFVAVLVMGILILLWLKISTVWIHDALMILGLSGVASFFGLGFTPSTIVFLLLIFSVYDFIAVYKTKHMVLMAKEMIEKKVILGFIIPKKIEYFKAKLSQIKPGGNFMILGGGDIVFPCLLAVSVVPTGFLKSLIVVVFSFCGSFVSYYLFIAQKNSE